MNIADLFAPVPASVFEGPLFAMHDALLEQAKVYREGMPFPADAEADIVILGVPEYRGSAFGPGQPAVDEVRRRFYSLKRHNHACRIADIGNFIAGNSVEDTYFALSGVITDLIQKNIFPLVIGGSQDLTYAQYRAYENMEQVINITSVDARFDLGGPDEKMNSLTWLGKIVLQQPNYLFNFSNIGHQTYYVGQEQVQLMEKLFFDSYRLGQVQSDLTEVEPIIRNADIMTFDLSAVRQSDAPAVPDPSPNGFYGQEACQIMQYAGLSDKLSGLGLYELDGAISDNGQTAGLAAQMVWYFIEGFSNRMRDLPARQIEQGFTIYRVPVSGDRQQITFLKSKKTDRWWMELPSDRSRNKLLRSHFLPCSYRDYEQACNNEIPDRWWQALQKMS